MNKHCLALVTLCILNLFSPPDVVDISKELVDHHQYNMNDNVVIKGNPPSTSGQPHLWTITKDITTVVSTTLISVPGAVQGVAVLSQNEL